jgi:hypothetical protein
MGDILFLILLFWVSSVVAVGDIFTEFREVMGQHYCAVFFEEKEAQKIL